MCAAKKIAVFNHKGGVGKTSLTINIAHALAHLGRRVLLVDSDPQCSLTTYLVDAVTVDTWLDTSEQPEGRTLWSAFHAMANDEGPIKFIDPIEKRENVFLVPGDIRLSALEESLYDAFVDCARHRLKGYKQVCAVSSLCEFIAEKYEIDYIFYDSGPNIGPLNKSLILDCDGIIIPVACDDFSLRALKTLGNTLVRWIREWEGLKFLAPDNAPILRGMPTLMGYIPQRFKIYAGQPTEVHAGLFAKLEGEVYSQVAVRLKESYPKLANLGMSEYKIGEVKDYGVIATKAQQSGVPWWETSEKSNAALETFESISQRIIKHFESEE